MCTSQEYDLFLILRILLHNTAMVFPKTLLGTLGIFGMLSTVPQTAEAALPALTYRFTHLLTTIAPRDMEHWQESKEQWTYEGNPIIPPAKLRVDGDELEPLPDGFQRSLQTTWSPAAIAQTIQEKIAPNINRTAGTVTISRTASGTIAFDGIGFPGRAIDMEATTNLTLEALKTGISDITLPVIETQPTIIVNDAELRAQGIKEFVTMGESDFHGSTANRIHNVTTGLNRFNGHLIEKDEIFSFVEVLGPVNASTGYRKELTIIGDKTLPDYGGGLCQVSSTAYRGAWEYGFPILQRKNHSFAVHYYAPQGTDATVYPPNVDIKFKNDSPGALLMQTVIDVPNTKAYFIYYGTKDDRQSAIAGPYSWGYTPAPPPRTEETTEIPAGTKRKVGEAVPGLHTAWFRTVKQNEKETTQGTYSIYQARPLYWQVGVESLPAASGDLTDGSGEAVISD